MSYALYRKYRPQTFEHLIGQASIRITILEALKKNKLTHAYLFSGPRGTGKTSTARLIAKAILCENRLESGEACEKCGICESVARGDIIDIIEIDAASNRGIDDIRDLREKLRFAPTRAKSKVYIIDEVHMLSKEAFNALLKSLEEPPSHVFFILATTEINKIPETILSRCQRYDFKRIAEKQIVERLKFIAEKESLEYESAALELLAKHADGGMRDAISLLEQFSSEKISVDLIEERLGLKSHQYCDALFGALGSGNTQKGLEIIESLHTDGFDLQEFTTSFLGLLRKKLHDAVLGEKKAIIQKLLDWTALFDEAWIKLKRSSIAQLPLEIAIIKATHNAQTGINPVQEKRVEGLIHIEALKKRLPEIVDNIENVPVRNSFQTGNLIGVEGKMLKFAFSSKFHYEKVNSAEGIVSIETAFQKILGPECKILTQEMT